MKKNLFSFLLLSLVWLICLMPFASFAQDNINSPFSNHSVSDKHNHTKEAAMNAPKAKTPLTFIENKNQWDDVVKYRASIPSGFLFIRQNSLQYSFYDANALKLIHAHGEEEHEGHEPNEEISSTIKAHSFEVAFENSNPSPQIISEQVNETKFNYILGNDPSRWAENTRGFGELTYKDLYPNIDLHLYLKEDNLKYDFIVSAGANPSKIGMNYKYADKVSLESGHLHIQTSVNEVIEQAPYSYQIIDGKKVEVPSKFVLKYAKDNKKGKSPQVTFEFPEGYNKKYELIIDPILIFSTFSGASSDNWGNTATYDDAGNLYSGGTSFGGGFPITTGAFDVDFGGEVDVAILKYNSQGTGIFYATFLGGSSSDVPSSMVVNSRNELIILGTTGSSNFPTTSGSYDNTFDGGTNTSVIGYDFDNGSDIFVSKLNSSGTRLVGSTFLGGQGNDGINSLGFDVFVDNPLVKNYGDEIRAEINIDNLDNIYIASTTNSNNFPLVSAHRTTFQGRQEGVGAKFDPTLSSLLWSTYIGGNGIDAAFGIQLSQRGDIYVVGGTLSNDLITHAATMESNYRGEIDGFIVRYASNFAWQGASYLGTPFYDQAYYVDVDESGSVYIFGQTQGSQPVTSGVYSNARGGLFIRKVSSNLNNIVWATTIGSQDFEPNITPTAFMVNDCGYIYLAGWGSPRIYQGRPSNYLSNINTTGLPITSNALQSTTDGNDFYTMILDENAQSLVYGSFFGGSGEGREHVDGGTSRFDKKTGTIYQAVCACSGSGFTTTPGAFSNQNNSSNCNNAAFKIEMGILKADFDTNDGVLSGCVPFSTTFVNQSVEGVTYEWDFGGLGVSTQDDNVPFTFDVAGTYQVRLIATNPILCIKKDTAYLEIVVSPADFTISPDVTICRGESTQLEATGGVNYLWTPTTGLSDPTIANPIASPTTTTTYSLTTETAAGCRGNLTTTVTVLPELIASFGLTLGDVCDGDSTVSIINTSQNATSYLWDFGNGQTSTAQNPPTQSYSSGTYTIRLIATNALCNAKDTVERQFVIDTDTFDFNFSSDTTICFGESVQLNVTGGDSYQWTPATGLNDATIGNPIASPTETTTYTIKVVGSSGCEEERQIQVVVAEEMIPNFDIVQSTDCNEAGRIELVNNTVGADSYLWDFGNGQTSTQQNPSVQSYTAGTYIIKLVTESESCNDKDSVEKQIVITQDAFIYNIKDTTICEGQSVQFDVTGGASYQWTPITGLSNATIGNPIASPAETTVYTVQVTGSNGCQEERQVEIVVGEEIVPSFDIVQSTDCAEIGKIELVNNTVGADSYLWDFGNGETSTQENPTIQNYVAGTYTIKLIIESEACNPIDSIEKQIVITEDTFVYDMDDATICTGQSVQFNVTGGVSYQWTPTAGLSDPTIGNPIASPTETTVYTVQVTGSNGCQEERQVEIVVGEEIVPNFDIVQSNECAEFPTISIINNTVGATSYLWDFGNGETSTAQNPTNIAYSTDGKYRIKLILNNIACSDSLVKELDYFTNDFFISPDNSICLGQSLPLEVGSGISYQWTPTAGLSDPTIANPIASPTETTTYTVSITTASGCIKEEEVTITVLEELKPDFDVIILDRCDKIPIVEIVNNSVGATSFFWDFGDGRTSTLRNPPSFQYASEGVYPITLRVENSLCQDSTQNDANSVIDDNNIFLSSIKMPESPTICRGENAQLNVEGGNAFEWTPATGLSDPTIRNPIASPDQTTIYNVRISNLDGGCFTDSTVTVTVVDKLVLDFDIQHSPECGAPATILFNGKNTGSGDWIWDLGNGETINVSNPTEYTYTEAGTYTITLKASNGVCDQEQTTTVTVDNVLPPNVITPNGDGLNETFVLDKANAGWKLQIYDRWGTEVFSADDYNNDWGSKAKPAMYYYYLTSPDGDTCRGWIHVLQ
ncbi:PKD domain-containing protein [Bernardetia sp. ABR2-2B]|uniref:DUF7948 domain-containing protein n=1 Tax=Bernardetia sp. ABR2-2B TaxID=3127472 RepID=UPI0030D4D3E4